MKTGDAMGFAGIVLMVLGSVWVLVRPNLLGRYYVRVYGFERSPLIGPKNAEAAGRFCARASAVGFLLIAAWAIVDWIGGYGP